MAKFISLVSGKGGVGKTTVALELASSLVKLGKKVVLLDADLYSPSVSVHLGRYSFPVTFNDVLEGKLSMKDALYDHPNGLTIVPLDMGYPRLKGYNDKEEIFSLDNVSKHLYELNDEADYVIIDTKNPFHPLTQSLIQFSRNSIMITTPDLASVSSNALTKNIIDDKNSKIVGIVSNKHTFDSDELSHRNISNSLGADVLIQIPHNDRLKDSIVLKNSISYLFDGEEMSNIFLELAKEIVKRGE